MNMGSVIVPPPPREVPYSVRFAVVLAHPVVQMACFWIAISSLLSMVFMHDIDFTPIYRLWSASGTGSVQSVDSRGSRFRYTYVFRASDGRRFYGQSYSYGEYYKPGERVEVEYLKVHPRFSRVRGLDQYEEEPVFPLPAVIILLLPAVGLYMLFSGITQAGNALWMLRYGVYVAEYREPTEEPGAYKPARVALPSAESFSRGGLSKEEERFASVAFSMFSFFGMLPTLDSGPRLQHPNDLTQSTPLDRISDGCSFDASGRCCLSENAKRKLFSRAVLPGIVMVEIVLALWLLVRAW